MDWSVLSHSLRNDDEIGTIGEAQAGMLPGCPMLQTLHRQR